MERPYEFLHQEVQIQHGHGSRPIQFIIIRKRKPWSSAGICLTMDREGCLSWSTPTWKTNGQSIL